MSILPQSAVKMPLPNAQAAKSCATGFRMAEHYKNPSVNGIMNLPQKLTAETPRAQSPTSRMFLRTLCPGSENGFLQ